MWCTIKIFIAVNFHYFVYRMDEIVLKVYNDFVCDKMRNINGGV